LKSRRHHALSGSNLDFRSKPGERFRFAAVGVAVTLGLSLVLGTYDPPVLKRLVNAVNDFQLSLLKETPPSPLPLIVEIDEHSLEELGQWPWPRNLVARLLGKLSTLGVTAVGVDAIFPEKDRTSPSEVARTQAKFREQLFTGCSAQAP